MELDKFNQPIPAIKNEFQKQKFIIKFKMNNEASGASQRYTDHPE